MLKFDIKKLKFDGQHAPHYGAYYKVWSVGSTHTIEKLSVMKQLTEYACYSGLFNMYNDHPDDTINGICMLHNIKPTTVTLTYDEIDRWIKLGIKHKMIPSHLKTSDCIFPNEINDNSFHIVAAIKCEGVPQALLYMYLNTIRELYEDPGFIKAVFYLHETLGINFYAAYVIASFFNKTGIGHSILPITRSMTLYKNNNSSQVKILKSIIVNDEDAKLDLNIVRALYRFVNDSTVFKGFPILRIKPKDNNRASYWGCIDKITAISKKEINDGGKMVLPIHYLDNKNIDNLISAPTEEAIKLLTQIVKEEENKT